MSAIQKALLVITRHALGIVLLAIGPWFLSASFELVVEGANSPQLMVEAQLGTYTALALLGAGVLVIIMILVSYSLEKLWKPSKWPASTSMASSLLMVVKFFLVPLSVVIAYALSKCIVLLFSNWDPWLVVSIGVLSVAIGYLLTRPLISKIIEVIGQLLTLVRVSKGAVFNRRLSVKVADGKDSAN